MARAILASSPDRPSSSAVGVRYLIFSGVQQGAWALVQTGRAPSFSPSPTRPRRCLARSGRVAMPSSTRRINTRRVPPQSTLDRRSSSRTQKISIPALDRGTSWTACSENIHHQPAVATRSQTHLPSVRCRNRGCRARPHGSDLSFVHQGRGNIQTGRPRQRGFDENRQKQSQLPGALV